MFDPIPRLVDLFFIEAQEGGEGEFPHSPIVYAFANPWVGHRQECSGERDLLTAESVCEQEWDGEMDWLEKKTFKDLKEVRRGGHEIFASYRKKLESQRKRESGT